MSDERKKSYYGPFFWLAVVSFAVPIVVAVKAFDAASRPHEKPPEKLDASGVDNKLWDYLLKMYVTDGLVDYEGMDRDHGFRQYVQQLGQAHPEKLSKDADRLALLCNAYNAFVINGVISHKIKTTVDDFTVKKVGFFSLKEHVFAGKTVRLNDIEHTMIRGKYKEPRIHMALVCAARSCPSLRPEAYVGATIERQLEDQARLFANSPKHVRFDADAKKIRLSAILKWYGDDFKDAGGYLKFLAERAKDKKLAKALKEADAGNVKVAFNSYDWTLNAQKKPAKEAGAAKKKTDFGSGSVPNE